MKPVSQEAYEYIQQYLTKCMFEDREAIYDEYIASIPKKRQKPQVSKELQGKWQELWKLWPSTNNFEYKGKKFTGTKVMKKNEALCMQKWLNALKDIEPDGIWLGAKVHLEYVKQASYKSGRNEMQYMNNLEVWLNGKVYMNWIGMQIPEEIQEQKKEVYENSTDM